METQIAKQFDKSSLIKIFKGALIAGTGAAALYILDWLGKIDIGVYTPLIGSIVPFLVNSIKEWLKGERR